MKQSDKQVNKSETKKDKIKRKLKFFKKKTKHWVRKNRYAIYMTIPFFLLDIITRIMGQIKYYPVFRPIPTIFTFIWASLFVGIIICSKGIVQKLLYWIFYFIAFFLYIMNNVYYSMTKYYFSFNLLESTGEGKDYMMDAILGANKLIYIFAVLIFILTVVIFIKFPKSKRFRWKRLGKIIIIFIVLHSLAPLMYGLPSSDLEWNNFKRARSVYANFNEPNKSMKVTGLYEYTARSFYMEYIKPEEKINKEESAFLDSIYNAEDTKTPNDYTGIFEGKNVIFLQLEGMDSWTITKKNTPTLYQLMNEGINFENHYSIYTGGGSTFNSEFAVNTGFTTPISFIENVYNYNHNSFPYSMPRMFKDAGYSVNAFHMNSGEFYSRAINYENWGYDNYYGLVDIQDYDDDTYKLDRELIKNPTFEELMLKHKRSDQFVDYIITYTPHTPFTTEKGTGQILAEEKYGSQIPELSEEECVRLAVHETDEMVRMLIERLKERKLYKNTVIVAFADHYLYTLEDKTILDKYKITQNNLINHTPFFIWSGNKKLYKPAKVKEVTMQMDILPTVLNLCGIDYNSNYYLGSDALNPNRKGYAFFSDYSWYDGQSYVENGKVTYGKKLKKKDIKKTSEIIGDIIRKNDLTLKFDRFSTISKQK